MSRLQLQSPTPTYDPDDQRNLRSAIAAADEKNLKRGVNIEQEPIIRSSPDGNRWVLGVSNAGVTTWTLA